MNSTLETYAVVWFYLCLFAAFGAAVAYLIEYLARRSAAAESATLRRISEANATLRDRAPPPPFECAEFARAMTRADHLAIESEREPAEIQADFRRDIPTDPATGLRFHPHMTLLAASRIAGERGFILTVEWSKLGGMKVTTIRRSSPQFGRSIS